MTQSLDFNELVICRIGEQRAQERVVERVAGATAFELADHRGGGECEIADGVENLVAHEFVAKALQLRIENALAVDRERVGERGAVCEAGAPQGIELVQKSEGARGRDVAPESFARKNPREMLR